MKNIIKFWKDNISAFLDEYFVSKNKATKIPDIPNPPTPPELTKEQIEAMPVSCLVLGLIKSIKENPEEWVMEYHSYWRTFANQNKIYRIAFEDNPERHALDTLLPVGNNLENSWNKREQFLLKEAIDNFLKIQYEKFVNEQKERIVKQNKYFEDLGCPVKVTGAKKSKYKKK